MSEKKTRDDRQLMRLHDGELEGEERAKAEAGLDDEGRARLSALGDLGAALRHTMEAETEGFDVWAGVEKGIPKKDSRSFGEWFRGLMKGYRAVWIPGMAAAVAAVAIYVGPWGSAVTNGCDIESLEVTGAAITVLKVPDVKGEGTMTVVWLDEEEE